MAEIRFEMHVTLVGNCKKLLARREHWGEKFQGANFRWIRLMQSLTVGESNSNSWSGRIDACTPRMFIVASDSADCSKVTVALRGCPSQVRCECFTAKNGPSSCPPVLLTPSERTMLPRQIVCF